MNGTDQFMVRAQCGVTFIADSNSKTRGRPGVQGSARCRSAANRFRKASGCP